MKRTAGLKTSFFYRLVVYFILMIIIPVLCFWWIYEKVLNHYYTENTLAARQINMENSLSIMDSSLDAADNAFVALSGNQEVVYYLDYRSGKSNMPYGAFSRIKYFCEELNTMTPYLNSLKIYCDSPLVIYANPLVRLEKLWQEDTLNALEQAELKEIVWRLEFSDEEEFPAIYGYRKLYTETYLKCIGYMEVQLSPQLLRDYFEVLSSLTENTASVLTLYQGNIPVYSTAPEAIEPVSVEGKESGYEIMFLQNQYRNYLMIPELDLCVVCSGRLSDLNVIPSQHIPSMFISAIIILLLGLSVGFFMIVVSLSKRILAFSSFIRSSDSNNLLPFHPRRKQQQRMDELDELIDTYNNLITENNTLISKIEKMELLTQAARFQTLQGQIHPHFIYGTLESIRMTALLNRDKEAADMIFALSSLIRYSISISNQAVTLQDELEIAKHYLTIQKKRFGDRLDYDFRIDEKLLGMELPAFILQPILENAIVYGISKTLDSCKLIVDAYQDENCIILKVSNNGLQIALQRLEEVNELLSGKISQENFNGNGNGMALNNIRERISIFFSGDASIQLATQEDYTVTIIKVRKK